MRAFGYYVVKPLPAPGWCRLDEESILSVSENGLSEKFPDLAVFPDQPHSSYPIRSIPYDRFYNHLYCAGCRDLFRHPSVHGFAGDPAAQLV